MENLPIDAKSLPSRIFHSETEDKIYVGEPGNYKEVGGDIKLDDIIEPTANQFLVGNSAGTDWEKRGINAFDLGIIGSSTNAVITYNATTGLPTSTYTIAAGTTNQTIPLRGAGGRLPGIGNAVVGNEAVPLGQLQTFLSTKENVLTAGTNINIDRTDPANPVISSTGGGITALTGDVTASGTGSVTATIPNGTVTNAKMANMSGFSVKGKPTTGSGAPSDIALSTNQLLGRGTGNVQGIAVGNGLEVVGNTLQTKDRYTKTHYVDLSMSMAQFLNSHNVKIPFPALGLTGEEHAIIESYVGEIKFDVSGGSLLPNNADTMRPQIFNSTGSQELAFSSYGNPQISPITGNVHLVNQFFMNNWLNRPTTGFMYGNYVAVNVSGSPTGSVRVRVYYKISNFGN